MTHESSILLACESPRDGAALRLVCFPHAGGSASFFRSWAGLFPDAEVYAAHYPGRAARVDDPPATDLRLLAVEFADAVARLADRPIALFGHSMGAAVAFETARELERRGIPVARLFASGSRDGALPDDLGAFDEDPEAVVARLVSLGGTDPEAAADPVFRDLVVPYVIDDGRMFRSYAMAPDPVLRCPITAIVGDADADADQRPWSELTSGGFTELAVQGDHFYLVADPPVAAITQALREPAAERQDAEPADVDASPAAERDDRYVWHPWSPIRPDRERVMISRGRGHRVWSTDGREFIDASSLNSTCGYSHPHVVDAVHRQLRRLHGVDLSATSHDQAGLLAERLAEHLPASLSRTALNNSGSEGIEAALLIASGYWSHLGNPRSRVVTFARGYHGSTALTRSLSGLPPTTSPFGSPLRTTRVELPVPAREVRDAASLPALIAAFDRAIGDDPADRPIAVLVEPLINVGGAVVLPRGFLRALKELCDVRNTLLVIDEVFTGCARTGRMFAFQHDGVEPDIVVSSKGLSGGYAPISAVTAQQHIHDTFVHDPYIGGLRYGHTTSGHAVACAAAVATLEVIEKEGLIRRAEELGTRLLSLLAPLSGQGSVIDVRGLGLITVAEFETEEAAAQVVRGAQDRGLLLRQQGQAVMAVPPLTVEERVLEQIAERFAAAAGEGRVL